MDDERKVYDARGNGDGECVPTITGDHSDRVTDFCPVVLDMGGGKIGAKFNMENVSPTITRGRGDADDVHAVCFNITACDANGTRKDRPNGGLYVTEAGSSRALTAGGGRDDTLVCGMDCYNQSLTGAAAMTVGSSASDPHHIPCVCERQDVIAAIDGDKLNKKERAGGSGLGVNGGDVSYTCTAKDVHGVVTGGCRYAVRRLMPVECERLFGLPDGYTIPAGLEITDALVDEFIGVFLRWNEIESGGKPVKPKTRKWVRQWLEKVSNPETCPDAPRYKAVGNSFGVNCVRWIGLGIQAVQDEIDAEERK